MRGRNKLKTFLIRGIKQCSNSDATHLTRSTSILCKSTPSSSRNHFPVDAKNVPRSPAQDLTGHPKGSCKARGRSGSIDSPPTVCQGSRRVLSRLGQNDARSVSLYAYFQRRCGSVKEGEVVETSGGVKGRPRKFRKAYTSWRRTCGDCTGKRNGCRSEKSTTWKGSSSSALSRSDARPGRA